MFTLAGVAAGASALPVALKAAGELHRTVFLSNTLARQGISVPAERSAGERLARQRASGISGGVAAEDPQYMGKVPARKLAGDLRKDYKVDGGPGTATSSKGILNDILDKVPRKTVGSADYKKINRPAPSKAPGFGNQSYSP